MKNPYFYLFYRFNQFFNKKKENEWGPIAAITFFTGQYLSIGYGKIFNINEINFSENKIILFSIGIGLFILNSILFLSPKKVGRIMKSYQNESVVSRKAGGFIVIFYIIAPIAS